MNQYTEFKEIIDGSIEPEKITNLRTLHLPVRSSTGPANRYVRITGVANDPIDPPWETIGGGPLSFHRGLFIIIVPQEEIEPSDLILGSCVSAGLAQLERDEAVSPADFGIAIDEVSSLTMSSTGHIAIVLKIGYKGDCWMPAISFAADILVYRPSLDNVKQPPVQGSEYVGPGLYSYGLEWEPSEYVVVTMTKRSK